MTGQDSILNNYYPCDWAAEIQERHWPVALPPADKPLPGSFAPPPQFFSPIAGSLAVWCPGKRRRILDRCSARLLDKGLPGTDTEVNYLSDKYTKNLTGSTIDQAGRVTLSFLIFLDDRNTNIFQVTRQDINSFVAHKQDQGLKINSVTLLSG